MCWWRGIGESYPFEIAGGEELESHIPSRLRGGEPVWYSFRTCLSQNFFDQGVNEWVECNIASGVRVDDHIQCTSLFGFLTALLWHERNQVVFNGKRFDVSNVRSKFVQ